MGANTRAEAMSFCTEDADYVAGPDAALDNQDEARLYGYISVANSAWRAFADRRPGDYGSPDKTIVGYELAGDRFAVACRSSSATRSASGDLGKATRTEAVALTMYELGEEGLRAVSHLETSRTQPGDDVQHTTGAYTYSDVYATSDGAKRLSNIDPQTIFTTVRFMERAADMNAASYQGTL